MLGSHGYVEIFGARTSHSREHAFCFVLSVYRYYMSPRVLTHQRIIRCIAEWSKTRVQNHCDVFWEKEYGGINTKCVIVERRTLHRLTCYWQQHLINSNGC